MSFLEYSSSIIAKRILLIACFLQTGIISSSSMEFAMSKVSDTCPKFQFDANKGRLGLGLDTSVIAELAKNGEVKVDRNGQLTTNPWGSTTYYLVDVSYCSIKTEMGCDERVTQGQIVKGRETVLETLSIEKPLIGSIISSPARDILKTEVPAYYGATYDGSRGKGEQANRVCYYSYTPNVNGVIAPEIDNLKIQFSISKIRPSIITQSIKQMGAPITSAIGNPKNTRLYQYGKKVVGPLLSSSEEVPPIKGKALSKDIKHQYVKKGQQSIPLSIATICPQSTASAGYQYIQNTAFDELIENGKVNLDSTGAIDNNAGKTYYLYKVYHCDTDEEGKCKGDVYSIEHAANGIEYMKKNPLYKHVDKTGQLMLKGGGYTPWGRSLCVYSYTPTQYLKRLAPYNVQSGYDTSNDILVILSERPPHQHKERTYTCNIDESLSSDEEEYIRMQEEPNWVEYYRDKVCSGLWSLFYDWRYSTVHDIGYETSSSIQENFDNLGNLERLENLGEVATYDEIRKSVLEELEKGELETARALVESSNLDQTDQARLFEEITSWGKAKVKENTG